MDYVPGCSLRELIAEQGALEPKCAADLLIQMCHGLHQAHGSGLVHRDIKPGNLLLQADPTNTKSGWRVCIVDFGLVRLTDSDAGTSASEVIAGTPAYMRPEQITAPESVGPASDIYGLGITLYEMLTGGVPWGGTPHMIMKQILEATPRTPRQWNDAIPVDLETICLKARMMIQRDDTPPRCNSLKTSSGGNVVSRYSHAPFGYFKEDFAGVVAIPRCLQSLLVRLCC